MNALLVLEGMSSTEDTNFLVAHHPLLHIGCFNGAIMTMDWTMQNSLSPTTLDRVSAIFSGHMHWLQVLAVGHGGTKLFNSSIDEELYPHIRLVVGEPEIYLATIERGYTMNEFGYAIMERNDDLNYDVTFYVFNQTTREILEMEDHSKGTSQRDRLIIRSVQQ